MSNRLIPTLSPKPEIRRTHRARRAFHFVTPSLRHSVTSGFTLIEASISIALSTILVVVVGAALTQSVSATERGSDTSAKARLAGDALDQLSADLALATSFHERSANAVEFSVPDRYGQGYNPVVRYQWSGTKGDPLLRSYDGSALVPVLGGVQSLNLSYLVRPAPVSTESAEFALRSCDSPTGSTLAPFEVSKDDWCAQYVFPTLPAGTTSWSITKARLRLARAGGGSNIGVQIRTADAFKSPTSTVLAETVVALASLSTAISWVDVTIGPVTGLSPAVGVCVVVVSKSSSGGDKLTVGTVTGTSSMPVNTHWFSYKAGDGWSAWDDQRDMRFYLYGKATATKEQPPQ